MTNMTVMAVYGKTLKNLFSQKHGIETAFYKTRFGFIYYQVLFRRYDPRLTLTFLHS